MDPLGGRIRRHGGAALLALAAAAPAATAVAAQGPPAPAISRIQFDIYSVTPDPTVCVGATTPIHVAVDRTVYTSQQMLATNVTGISIQSAVVNPAIGTISPAQMQTTRAGGNFGGARFSFTGKKAGTMLVTFTMGPIPPGWVGAAATAIGYSSVTSTQVQVEVRNCRFRVAYAGTYRGGPLGIVARAGPIDLDIPLSGSASGSVPLTGSARLNVPGCATSVTNSPGTATVTASYTSLGRVRIGTTFSAITGTTNVRCGPVASGTRDVGRLAPLTFRFSDRGGVASRSHVILGALLIRGSATVRLIPIQP